MEGLEEIERLAAEIEANAALPENEEIRSDLLDIARMARGYAMREDMRISP